MNHAHIFLPSAIWTALTLAVPGTAIAQPDGAPLDWLAGCWQLQRDGLVIQEHWMPPQGGLMIGVSRTVIRDTARGYEYIRIESVDTEPIYVADPSGQEETAFPSLVISDSLAVFENPEHDFPQRISYRRHGPDSLLARIEGTRDGQSRSVDFPMARISCEP